MNEENDFGLSVVSGAVYGGLDMIKVFFNSFKGSVITTYMYIQLVLKLLVQPSIFVVTFRKRWQEVCIRGACLAPCDQEELSHGGDVLAA